MIWASDMKKLLKLYELLETYILEVLFDKRPGFFAACVRCYLQLLYKVYFVATKIRRAWLRRHL